jgi:hypothetical protein
MKNDATPRLNGRFTIKSYDWKLVAHADSKDGKIEAKDNCILKLRDGLWFKQFAMQTVKHAPPFRNCFGRKIGHCVAFAKLKKAP